MGCADYKIKDAFVHFSETNDDVGCLCTAFHNDGETLNRERVRSLALLGAMVVLVHQEERSGYNYIPNGVPDWIQRDINKIIGTAK